METKIKKTKKYKVSLNFIQVIDANTEDEAIEEMNTIFDNTCFKLDCKELK